MKDTEFHRYWYICEITGKRKRTSWHMTEADAATRPDMLERVEGSLIVRSLPESPDEYSSTSGWQRDKTQKSPGAAHE